jgi:Cu2+-exporting ATPase
VAVLLAAGLSCAYWWSHDPGHALMVAVAVLIVTCPCALSLATPAAMLAAAGNLAQRGVLVRRLEAFEALAEIDTVMFDKTGTLTRDAIILGAIQTRVGVSAEAALQQAAALAQHSLHPVSKALLAAAGGSEALHGWEVQAASEVAGQGVSAQVTLKGDSQSTCELRLGSAAFCGVDARPGASLQAHLSDQGGWMATFELLEDVRPDARATVKVLQDDGISVCLLSGDGKQAAARVGAEVGINQVRGDCSPQDKLDFLRQAQLSKHKAAVVGDGLNDGPVLAGAHVSFAFGSAVPLAQAQSDFVILGDQLGEVSKTLFLARRTMRIVRENLMWSAIYNAVCVPLAVVGWMPAWLAGLGMALSSLVVVLNAMRLSKQVENA